jgi:HTH-type transcriptional regulator/antitoxin HigA
LIPSKQWTESRLAKKHTPEAVRTFAEKLRICPSIPAGRIRFEKNDYRILKDLVGSGKVRWVLGVAANQRN